MRGAGKAFFPAPRMTNRNLRGIQAKNSTISWAVSTLKNIVSG